MSNLSELLLFIIYCFSILVFALLYKYWPKERVQNRASWFLTEKTSFLLDYVNKSCSELNIEEQCKIDASETTFAEEILKVFQDEMKERYIGGYYTVDYFNAKMSFPDYFMFYFEKFLSDKSDMTFNGKTMSTVIEKKTFEWGAYEEICDITDFGIVYYKLFYFSRLYCANSKYLTNPKNKKTREKDYSFDGLKEKVVTRKTSFYTGR